MIIPTIVLGVILVLIIKSALLPSLRAFLSPIPGPCPAKSTVWYLRYCEAIGRREEYIERLHKKYGDVVYIAPQEVSVRSADAIRDVYASHRLDKPTEYWLEQYGETNLVSTAEASVHLIRRKVVASVYSAPSINSSSRQQSFRTLIRRFLDEIESEASIKGNVVNIYPLLRWLATDIMAHVVFGSDVALNTLQEEDDRRRMAFILSPNKPGIGNLPDAVLKWYPILMRRGIFTSLMNGVGNGETSVHSYFDKVYAQRLEKPANVEMPAHMDLLLQKYQEEGLSKSIPHPLYVKGDSADHFFAGCITSADASSALIWQLAQPSNRHLQLKLRKELQDAGLKPGEPADLSVVSKLSFLDSCLRETLRRHPPITFTQVREVRPGQDVRISGHKIPSGTRVGAQHYSVHRQPDAFPDAERWDPSRWEIEHNSPDYILRPRHFWPFGTGQRMCIGFNIAWAEMRHVAAAVFSTYGISLSKDWLDKNGRLLCENQRQHMWPYYEWEPIVFNRLYTVKNSTSPSKAEVTGN